MIKLAAFDLKFKKEIIRKEIYCGMVAQDINNHWQLTMGDKKVYFTNFEFFCCTYFDNIEQSIV